MSKLSLLTLTTTLFLQLVVVSVALDPNHYGVCLPVRCGDVNISYPFYIPNKQRDFCGYPGFEVVCQNGEIPHIKISGDSYAIRNIWDKNQSFQVANSAFVDSVGDNNCFDSIRNLTLPDNIFSFAEKHHKNIFLLPNCTKKIVEEYPRDLVKCGALGFYEGDPGLKNLRKECGQVVSVPYEGTQNGGADIRKVLSRGVVLNWTANNCSACIETGGQCGFDRVTHETRCYCRDRAHSYHCVRKKKRTGLRIGLGVSGGIALLTAALVALWYRKKLKFGHSKFVSPSVSLERSQSELEKGNIYFGVPLFSYSELEEATDHFNQSKELGDGGFGTVYYGKLKDGREVAVKRLFEKSYKRVEQFTNEVQILTCLRHQNLVSLYGCTSHHCSKLLLVYEYVPNGTVADHLYGDKAKPGYSLGKSV